MKSLEGNLLPLDLPYQEVPKDAIQYLIVKRKI